MNSTYHHGQAYVPVTMKVPVKKRLRSRHGNKYLKSLLVELAWSATRTKVTYFRAKYESMVGRRGKKRLY
ncbi:MAG: transposase [Bacteroidales bacterium]